MGEARPRPRPAALRGEPRHQRHAARPGRPTSLYVAQGGNTNMGAPSHNFAFLPEYALSAAILSIDLNAIGDTTYDIPTLDDLSRAEQRPAGSTSTTRSAATTARTRPSSSPAGRCRCTRPATATPTTWCSPATGRLYTIDNGPNAGWGGVPLDARRAARPPPPPPAPRPTRSPSPASPTTTSSTTSRARASTPATPTRRAPTSPTRSTALPDRRVDLAVAGRRRPTRSRAYYRVPGVDDGSLTPVPDSTNGLDRVHRRQLRRRDERRPPRRRLRQQAVPREART